MVPHGIFERRLIFSGCRSDHDTVEEWFTALRVSHMWTLRRVSSKAIVKLDKCTLDPVRKVELAKDFSVGKWLEEGIIELALRSSSLSEHEAKQVGWETATRLAQLRNALFIQRQAVLHDLVALLQHGEDSSSACPLCGAMCSAFRLRTVHEDEELDEERCILSEECKPRPWQLQPSVMPYIWKTRGSSRRDASSRSGASQPDHQFTTSSLTWPHDSFFSD